MNPEQKPQNPENPEIAQVIERMIENAREFTKSLTGRVVGEIAMIRDLGEISDIKLWPSVNGDVILMEVTLVRRLDGFGASSISGLVSVKTKIRLDNKVGDGNNFIWRWKDGDTEITLSLYAYDVLMEIKKFVESVIKSE